MTRFRVFAIGLLLLFACAGALLPAGPAVPASEATQAHTALALASLSVRAVDELAAHWWASLRAPLAMDLAAYEGVTGAVAEARVEIRAAYAEIDQGRSGVDRIAKANALLFRACADLTRLGARPPAELTHAIAIVRAYSMGR